MKEFSNVSFVVAHSYVNINMDSKKRVHQQTNMYGHLNKQTNKHVYGHFKSHRTTLTTTKRQMKWQGLDLHGCLIVYAYCHRDLWFHQCSLISMTWSGLSIGWTTQVPAPPSGTAYELTSWEQKEHVLYWLHDHQVFILQLFNWDLIPYFEILPFPQWHNHNKWGIILKRIK